jgi:8-oxo-dGTP pyrophosphatase MutT (NUDIX family)
MARRLGRKHDTAVARKLAGLENVVEDAATVGTRVETVDGPGVITEIQDGYGGTISYVIALDDDRGGGEYRSNDVLAVLEPKTARRYSGVPMACDDCGKPAESSTAGGPDGHRMLCDDCRGNRGKAPRKTTAGMNPTHDSITDSGVAYELSRTDTEVSYRGSEDGPIYTMPIEKFDRKFKPTVYTCMEHAGQGWLLWATPEHPCATCGATSRRPSAARRTAAEVNPTHAAQKTAADFDPALATDTCVFCHKDVMFDDDSEMYLAADSWMWCPAREGMEPHEVDAFRYGGLVAGASRTASYTGQFLTDARAVSNALRSAGFSATRSSGSRVRGAPNVTSGFKSERYRRYISSADIPEGEAYPYPWVVKVTWEVDWAQQSNGSGDDPAQKCDEMESALQVAGFSTHRQSPTEVWAWTGTGRIASRKTAATQYTYLDADVVVAYDDEAYGPNDMEPEAWAQQQFIQNVDGPGLHFFEVQRGMVDNDGVPSQPKSEQRKRFGSMAKIEQKGSGPRTAARAPLPLLSVEELRAQGAHVASDDYPELAEILWERPDLVEAQPIEGLMPRRLTMAKVAAPTKPLPTRQPEWLIPEDPSKNPIKRTLTDKNQPWWWRKVVGPMADRFNDALPPNRKVLTDDDLRRNISDHKDWCRFRDRGNCMFPKEFDEQGSKEAGYPVWIPFDRGACPWESFQNQKFECKVSEPGPDSGERTVYPEATRSWSQGGQRMGSVTPVTVRTAAWADVRSKAKRIKDSGGVRIIAVADNTITGEIRGDSGLYTSTVTLVPGTKQVAISTCSCPWETYRWARSGIWKKFEGRACAHVTALLFEMQSRSMFGGEITEDAGTPEWRTSEPSLEAPRSTPGPWRLDEPSARPVEYVAALHAHRRAVALHHASLDAVAKHDPSYDPQVGALALALASMDVVIGSSAEGMDEDSPCLVSLAGLSREGQFWAQVDGRIREFDAIDDDGFAWSGSSSVPISKLLYPTYDRTLGLTASLRTAAEESEGLDDIAEADTLGKYTHAGLIVKALDSGRVLMTQRTPYHQDDEGVYGKWEFPGGSLDEGETPLIGAMREFAEETGLALPEGWDLAGCIANDTYLAIVCVVPHETWTTDADLLVRETMGIGWFEPDHVEDAEFVREEVVESTDWDSVHEASKKTAEEESWFDQGRREHPDWSVIDGVLVAPDYTGQWHETNGVWVFRDAGSFACLRGVAGRDGQWVWEVHVPVGFGPNSGKTLTGTAKTLDDAKAKAMAATKKDDEANGRYMERQRQLLSSATKTKTAGKEHPLFSTWRQIQFAMSQTNARGRAAAESKAYAMLREWDGFEGESQSLLYYSKKLDPIVWPEAHEATAKTSSLSIDIPWNGEREEGFLARPGFKYPLAYIAQRDDDGRIAWATISQGNMAVIATGIKDTIEEVRAEVEQAGIGKKRAAVAHKLEECISVGTSGAYVVSCVCGWTKRIEGNFDTRKRAMKALAAHKAEAMGKKEAVKGDGIDACKHCGSESLWSSYFDKDGNGSEGNGPTDEWDTVCENCGKFQNRRNTPNPNRERRGDCAVCGASVKLRQDGRSWKPGPHSHITNGGVCPGGMDVQRRTSNVSQPQASMTKMEEDILFDMAAQDVARDWPEEVHMEFFRRQGPVSPREDLRLDSVVPNPDAHFDPANFYESLTDEHVAEAVLHEEPQPALPEAYGELGDGIGDPDRFTAPPAVPNANDGRLDAGDADGLTPQSNPDELSTEPFVPGDQRLAWLASDGPAEGGEDIAAAARAFLAKTALKDFSAAEQQALISEGEDEMRGARNTDRLVLAGTHYEAIESDVTDDELLW